MDPLPQIAQTKIERQPAKDIEPTACASQQYRLRFFNFPKEWKCQALHAFSPSPRFGKVSHNCSGTSWLSKTCCFIMQKAYHTLDNLFILRLICSLPLTCHKTTAFLMVVAFR